MSLLFGGGPKAKPQFTGLSVQTSTSNMPIALIWGRNRHAPNIIWQGDFASHKQKQKAGKGGPKSSTFTYSASFQLALCWGEIEDVVRVWRDQSKETSYAALGFSLFKGTTPQSPWGYLTSAHPDAALGYSGIAHLDVPNYDLGNGNSLPQHSFEIKGLQWNTGYNAAGLVDDADPAAVATDFLSNPSFGVGFNMAILEGLTSTAEATTTGDSTFQTYCRAAGFALSPVLGSQTEAGETLQRWATLCNTAIVWTGYALKLHPYGPDEISNNGVVYLPNFDVRYTLTDKDYISDKGKDPITFERIDPADAFNSQSMIIANKENEYNDLPVPWRDQGLVDQYGLRKENNLEAKEITDPAMAAIMISLIGQRRAYVRNRFRFELPLKYCLLEPMDVLECVDPRLGTFKVLITDIEETDDGTYEVSAEEYTPAISSTENATGYTSEPTSNTPIDTNVSPGPVNPPIIFEPPSSLSSVAQVWAAVSGGDGTTADVNWGGANVWLSTDDVTYVQIGQVSAPARMGKLTSTLATYGGVNPDTANTLEVNLTMSRGELSDDASPDDAEAGATLCYVDGELVSYEITTLTSTYNYDLDDLWRGQYGSTIGSHTTGSDFARLDEAIFKYDLPTSYIGRTLYLKFQSFNVFEGAVQDIADCVAYTYVPVGSGFGTGTGGLPSVPTGFTATDGVYPYLEWDPAPANDSITGYNIWRDVGPAGTYGAAVLITTVSAVSISFSDSSVPAPDTYTYFLEAVNSVGASAPTSGQDATCTAGGGSGSGGSGGGILPVVDGSIPPTFIQNPDGSLVFTEIL